LATETKLKHKLNRRTKHKIGTGELLSDCPAVELEPPDAIVTSAAEISVVSASSLGYRM